MVNRGEIAWHGPTSNCGTRSPEGRTGSLADAVESRTGRYRSTGTTTLTTENSTTTMTKNHDYNTPAEGTSDWHVPINENFAQIDKDVEIRDKDSNRGSYEPKQGAKFLATDTGDVYLGDGSSWNWKGTISATSGSSDGGSVHTVVYQSGGETVAEAPGGVIASGDPVPTIEKAIDASKYVEISGNYTIYDEITVTKDERIIEAGGATFEAGGNHKLWHFDQADCCRFRSGRLDLTDSGKVALDIDASIGGDYDVQLFRVPGGTFSENGNSYDRCGVRVMGRNRGAYWNRIRPVKPYGAGGQQGGDGMVFDSTGQGANANTIISPKLTQFDVGVKMLHGTGNSFFNLECSGCNTGYLQRTGAYGSQNAFFGKAWLEHNDVGIDNEPHDDSNWDNSFIGMFGFASFGGTNTKFRTRDGILWTDYVRKEYNFAGMGLRNHREGSTGSDPTSQSPDGWLQITNENGNTKYVPYYG